MIKRITRTAIGMAMTLAIMGCETGGERVNTAEGAATGRTDEEINTEVDSQLDKVFGQRD